MKKILVLTLLLIAMLGIIKTGFSLQQRYFPLERPVVTQSHPKASTQPIQNMIIPFKSQKKLYNLALQLSDSSTQQASKIAEQLLLEALTTKDHHYRQSLLFTITSNIDTQYYLANTIKNKNEPINKQAMALYALLLNSKTLQQEGICSQVINGLQNYDIIEWISKEAPSTIQLDILDSLSAIKQVATDDGRLIKNGISIFDKEVFSLLQGYLEENIIFYASQK